MFGFGTNVTSKHVYPFRFVLQWSFSWVVGWLASAIYISARAGVDLLCYAARFLIFERPFPRIVVSSEILCLLLLISYTWLPGTISSYNHISVLDLSSHSLTTNKAREQKEVLYMVTGGVDCLSSSIEDAVYTSFYTKNLPNGK